jgi:methionyl-tRNA formyltransferase
MALGTPPVRVVAVTQDDPFFTGRFFETFLEAARPELELVEVVLLPNFNESRARLLRRLRDFYGPLGVARLVSRYARATLEERRGVPRSVRAVSARHGVPTLSLDTINDPEYLHTLHKRQVDVLLSVAAPEIFGPEALAAAPHVLNVHNGRLPYYRGMMPVFWALLAGDEVVVTVHRMDERLDAGAVVAEYPVHVDPGASAFDASRIAKAVAGRCVAQLLSTVGTEAWPEERTADIANGTYHGFPRREHARRLQASGRAVL